MKICDSCRSKVDDSHNMCPNCGNTNLKIIESATPQSSVSPTSAQMPVSSTTSTDNLIENLAANVKDDITGGIVRRSKRLIRTIVVIIIIIIIIKEFFYN